jgi:serine/threonine protein phosphatase PrpC
MLSRYSRAILTASPGDINAVVSEYISCVNASLCGAARGISGGADTALALAVVTKSAIRAYAIGEPGIYLMRGGKLRRMARDRVGAGRINIIPAIPVSDRCRLLICSDGLTDAVEDAQIKSMLQEAGDAANAGRGLIEAALANGGGDDVTCVVLDIAADKY